MFSRSLQKIFFFASAQKENMMHANTPKSRRVTSKLRRKLKN